MSDSRTHVLLIEDNPGDADLVRLRLVESRPAVRVDYASRLSDGLAAIAKEMPSLVLLDLNLPDSHGAETFRKIMEKAPGVPVVVLSGQDDEALAMKAVNQGVQDYLVKGDLSSKHLERAMRYAVERQSLLRKEAKQKDDAEKLQKMLDQVAITIRRKVGEQAALYGSVTNSDVADELEKKGFQIEKRKIHMEDHIKTLGEFSIPVRLFKDVTAHVKLKVEAETEA